MKETKKFVYFASMYSENVDASRKKTFYNIDFIFLLSLVSPFKINHKKKYLRKKAEFFF